MKRQNYRQGDEILFAQVKNAQRRFNLRPKKKLGQHFLVDEKVLECIVSAAELTPSDTVIEVGPGLGFLTYELAKRAGQVIAVELDTRLASLLTQNLNSFPNTTVVNADILQLNPLELVCKEKTGASPTAKASNVSYKVVANLPYYITSPILRHFLEAQPKPHLMVTMVQKEVGETIVATPGQMSLLSVSIQFYSKPTIVAQVPAQSFYPQPKVDSVILRIEPYAMPAIEVNDTASFFKLVEAGFSSRRKQLHNSLAQCLNLPPTTVASLLESKGVNHKRRAQTLSLEEWATVWRLF